MNVTFSKVAQKGKLTFGLVFPLESYAGSVPLMEDQESLALLAERLGFSALWFRDVPFHDPSFGDAGQMYDPWIYMAHIMNHTELIALATGSAILPLRYPVHTAKSILSLQSLSKGRVILGVASGDRPVEYPAFNRSIDQKSELFRDSFHYIKALMGDFPSYHSKHYGRVSGSVDLLPKHQGSTPMLITGHSGQSLDWIAQNGDGWLYYPRNIAFLQQTMNDWTNALHRHEQPWKPYMQSLYIDLLDSKTAAPRGIHLGFQSGSDFLLEHIKTIERIGVNHVIINLKFSSRPIAEVMEHLADDIMPHFI